LVPTDSPNGFLDNTPTAKLERLVLGAIAVRERIRIAPPYFP
jgi:hypothetical protein